MSEEIKVGDVVTWALPLDESERAERFTVVEVNGDRCIIRFMVEMPIPPTQLALVAELTKVQQ